MTAPLYSISEKQREFLSIHSDPNNTILINYLPLGEYKYPARYSGSYSKTEHQISSDKDYIPLTRYKGLQNLENIPFNQMPVDISGTLPSIYSVNKQINPSISCDNFCQKNIDTIINDYQNLLTKSIIEMNYFIHQDNRELIQKLKKQINQLYNEHQYRNWDGYNAEPLKYLQQSLKFVDTFLYEPQLLIESMDIIPENDGCLCFEWFKSKDKFINVSVKDDKLIYDYKMGDEEGCGETNFSGKEMLLNKIKKVV